MVIFSYEGVDLTDRPNVEQIALKFIKDFLKEDIEVLYEVVLTNNMKTSLEKRMIPEQFQNWEKEKSETYYQTGGKTFRLKPDEIKYSIVILCYEGIEPILLQILLHELYHVKSFRLLDEYKIQKEFSLGDRKKIDALFGLFSEYLSEVNEARYNVLQNDISRLEMFDLNAEAKRLIEKYRLSQYKDNESFQQDMEIAIGEFNSILIRHLGRCDGLDKSEDFDKTISGGVVSALFDESLKKICDTIRSFSLKGDVLKIAREFWELGDQQIGELNRNVIPLL